MTIGYNAGSGPTGALPTKLTVGGGGAMSIAGTTIAIGVDQSGAVNQGFWNDATLDVSGLSAFNANVTTFNIGVGSQTQGPGTVLLSNTANTIIATNLTVGDTGSNNGRGPGTLTLGTGTNVIQADTITIGRGKNSGNGFLSFASQAPGSPGTVVITDKAGTGPANITVANVNGVATGGGANGTLDLRGHNATVNAATLLIAQTNAASNVASTNGTVSFDEGTFTVATLNMALKSGASTGTATATLNVGGGDFTVNTGFTLGSQATAGASVATLNLTGGTLTSNVDIVAGAGTTTSTITLSGGTLDMTGKNIGGATVIDTLNLESGTLKDVAQINNGGAITKTTPGTLVLTGTHTWTGAANVTDGTLTFDATSVYSPAVGNGMVTVNGPSAVVNLLGTYNSPNGNGNAYFTIQGGGVLNFSGNSTLANAATSGGFRIGEGSTGTMNMTAGTLTLTLNPSSNFVVGRSAGGDGLLNLTGGTLTVNGGGGLIVANTATTSGTMTIGGTGHLVMNGTAGLTMGPGTSTINLNTGGTLTLASNSTASGASTFNFDGGTLQAGINTATLLPAALTSANVLAGGAKVDTNGFNVTIPSALLSGVAGDGGLTKSGTGTLTLGGANTYTGGTVVSTGTLRVNNSVLSSGGVSVSAGATFEVGADQGVNNLTLAGATGAWTAKVNLFDKDLVVVNPSSFADVLNQVKQGRDTGDWNAANGITTSSATSITGLAAIRNTDDGVNPIFATFNGVAVDKDAILIKYTYEGDADMNGIVDIDDYFRIDTNYALGTPNPTYRQGDFNYDNVVNADDYFLIDAAFIGQTGALSSSPIAPALPSAPSAAVPEPGTLSLLALGAAALLGRRRRSR